MDSDEEGLWELCGLRDEDFDGCVEDEMVEASHVTESARCFPPSRAAVAERTMAAAPAPRARKARTIAAAAAAAEAEALEAAMNAEADAARLSCVGQLLQQFKRGHTACVVDRTPADSEADWALTLLGGAVPDPPTMSQIFPAAICVSSLLRALRTCQRLVQDHGARGRLLLRLSGVLPSVIGMLHAAEQFVPRSAPTHEAKHGQRYTHAVHGTPKDGALQIRITAARLLSEVVRDDDAMHDVGAAGGHTVMLRILHESTSQEHELFEDEGAGELLDLIAETASRCAARASLSGDTFPIQAPPPKYGTHTSKAAHNTSATLRRAWRPSPMLVRRRRYPSGAMVTAAAEIAAAIGLRRLADDTGGPKSGGDDTGVHPGDDHDVVLLRSVPKRQEAQSTVGFMLWGGAVVMLNFLHATTAFITDLFPRGARVLELGAGVGLVGLYVAARFREVAQVTLSDFHDDILRNLHNNIAINDISCGHGSSGAALQGHKSSQSKVHVCHLDWDALEPDAETHDVILGTDLICCEANAVGVTRALQVLLSRPNGYALILNPSEHSRWAIGAFKEALNSPASGLCATITRIPKSSALLEGVHDKNDVEYELYYIVRR